MDRNRKNVDQFTVKEDGSTEYIGAYATFHGSEDDLLMLCRKVAYYDAVPILLLIATGCIPRSGLDGHPQLLIPYLVELIASFFIMGAVLNLYRGGTHPKQFEYEKSYDRIPQIAILLVVAAFAGLIGLGVLMATSGGKAFQWGMVIYCIAQAVCIIMGVNIYRFMARMEGQWDRSEFS